MWKMCKCITDTDYRFVWTRTEVRVKKKNLWNGTYAEQFELYAEEKDFTVRGNRELQVQYKLLYMICDRN